MATKWLTQYQKLKGVNKKDLKRSNYHIEHLTLQSKLVASARKRILSIRRPISIPKFVFHFLWSHTKFNMISTPKITWSSNLTKRKATHQGVVCIKTPLTLRSFLNYNYRLRQAKRKENLMTFFFKKTSYKRRNTKSFPKAKWMSFDPALKYILHLLQHKIAPLYQVQQFATRYRNF